MKRSFSAGVVALMLASIFSSSWVSTSSARGGKLDEPQPGRILERVVCKNNPEQTYSLYLPANYSPSRTWPLLAAFDPGARGNAPVEHFKEAAEQYGYIVCGSNNSRNGPMAPAAEAATAMLGDVTARFPIDEKRLYLTGFSGGGRVATTLAVRLSGQVAGVVGCGAGLAQGLEPRSLPFVYYGTVGTEDFNYPEMKQLDRSLESAGIAHHIEVFDGGHSWPPSDVCVRAIEWMELQAMKSGRRSRDDAFIDRLLKKAEEIAAADEASGRLYESFVEYAAIASSFRGIRDVGAFEKKTAVLRESKIVKQTINKDRDQENEQQRRVTELFSLRAKLGSRVTSTAPGDSGGPTALGGGSSTVAVESDSGPSPFTDLMGRLADLKRKSDAKESSVERALARRVLNQFLISSIEQSMTLVQAKRYDLAASNLALDSDLMPDNSRILYLLTCAQALKGDKRRAIEALSKAVQKGFTNVAELERNSQLDTLREEPGFKKIVEGLKQKR